MDQPSQDFITWLLADWHRAVIFFASAFVLPLAHRRLSVIVGQRLRPLPGEPYAGLWQVLARLSGAVWYDAPGSTKPILAPMPPGRLTPEGGFRSGDTPPGSGPRLAPTAPPAPRSSTPGGGIAGLLAACLLLSIGCGPSVYVRGMKAAGAVQEESVKRQGQEEDALLKAGWFLCNRWTDRYTRAGQAVLSARAEVARGSAGAETVKAAAEVLADKLEAVYQAQCKVAADASQALRGVPLGGLPAAAPPTPAAPAPGTPATPARPAPPAAPAPAPAAPLAPLAPVP